MKIIKIILIFLSKQGIKGFIYTVIFKIYSYYNFV